MHKFLQNSFYSILFSIICLQTGCDNKNKWTAVPLDITKRPSVHYSEMVSGDLDSLQKAELEIVKKITAKQRKENKNLDENLFKKISNWLKQLF